MKIGEETFVEVGGTNYLFTVDEWRHGYICRLKYFHDGRLYYSVGQTFIEALGEMLLFRHAIVVTEWSKAPSTQK